MTDQTSTSAASTGPLAGIRVLELARILAGPWCGQIFADLGADVIKIERPVEGDDTRHWGPPFMASEKGAALDAAYFHSCNRGKRSITLDLASPEGQERVRKLAAQADIVIENFKVGALARYGLDAVSLRTLNPGLIYCSITGFGQTGPYAHRAGYDFIIQAMGGVMSITGEPDGPPQKGGVAYADLFTGVYSAVGILAALHQRQATGVGAHLDMALLDTQVGVLGNQALNWMVSGVVPHRMGNGHVNLAPYQSFATADGDAIIAVGNDRQFASLCAVLRTMDLLKDQRYATSPGRVVNRATLIPKIGEATATWPTAELLSALEAVGVPAGPVNRIDQVFSDPQVVARGMQLAVSDADGVLPGLALPIVMDGKRLVARGAAPRLGADPASDWRS